MILGPADFKVGAHGYDNTEPSMRAMFIASGPAFKQNLTIQPFDNVNLCPLFSYVLQLSDEPRVIGVRPDGSLDSVRPLLLEFNAAAPSPHVRGIMMSSVALLLHVFAQRLQ